MSHEDSELAKGQRLWELTLPTDHRTGRAFLYLPHLAELSQFEVAWAVIQGLNAARSEGFELIDRAAMEAQMTQTPKNHALVVWLRRV